MKEQKLHLSTVSSPTVLPGVIYEGYRDKNICLAELDYMSALVKANG